MNRLVIFTLMAMYSILGTSSYAQSNVASTKKQILSNACILSYTDALGKITRVIRGNSLVVWIK